MAAIVLTLFAVPSAQASGAADTPLPGRVTAKVAPESSERGLAEGGVSLAQRRGDTGWRQVAEASEAETDSGLIAGGRIVVGDPRSDSLPSNARCKPARTAAVFFRLRTHTWQTLREGRLATRSPVVAGKSCHWAKFAAATWEARASSARRSYWRWLDDRTLEDFAFSDGNRAWPKAVREVQRVFPGTEGWLLSCSAAEGGHGRWVGYGGQGYSTWLRDSDTVGGNLQFRFSTFKGMFRRAVDHVYAHGYRVPIFSDYTAAWRSALGQALAGGWARWSGNDNSHWSASFGRGC